MSRFTERAAEESNRRAIDWVRQNLAALIASPLEVGLGEIMIHGAA